jgi:hypothetical protein
LQKKNKCTSSSFDAKVSEMPRKDPKKLAEKKTNKKRIFNARNEMKRDSFPLLRPHLGPAAVSLTVPRYAH